LWNVIMFLWMWGLPILWIVNTFYLPKRRASKQ
jgi:ABC-type polysaccharide/polyol phosphate export permease